MSLATEHFPITTPRDFTMAAIKEIGDRHGVSVADIMGKSRRRKIIQARNEAIRYIWTKKYPGWSYPVIGRFFGKDHSTVLYALGRLNNRKPKLWVVKAQSGSV